MSKNDDYSIHNLCELFKNHADEFDKKYHEENLERDFNLPRALQRICEALRDLMREGFKNESKSRIH